MKIKLNDLIWVCAVVSVIVVIVGIGYFKAREKIEINHIDEATFETQAIVHTIGDGYLYYVEHSSPEQAKVKACADPLVSTSDPWGNDYVVETDKDGYRVISLGKDGRKDTADDIICSEKWGQSTPNPFSTQ